MVNGDAFLLMRHGETEANARDLICGRTDLPLTARGLAQAKQAAAGLVRSGEAAGIEVILTSPLARARQTAGAVADALGLVPVVAEGLAERDWGEWEGQPRAILRREQTPPGGESPGAFHRRIADQLAALDLRRRSLIVAHSGAARVIHELLSAGDHVRMANGEVRCWSRSGAGWHCHEVVNPGH